MLDIMKQHEHFSVSMLSDDFTFEETGRITGIAARNREHPVTGAVFEDCANVLKNYAPKDSDNMSDDDLMDLFKSKKK